MEPIDHEHRTIIDRGRAITARALARAGLTAAAIAKRLNVTPHVARLFVEAPVDETNPAPPDISPTRRTAQASDVPLADDERSVEPQLCPTCRSRITIVPCRACRMRSLPRVRPMRRE